MMASSMAAQWDEWKGMTKVDPMDSKWVGEKDLEKVASMVAKLVLFNNFANIRYKSVNIIHLNI